MKNHPDGKEEKPNTAVNTKALTLDVALYQHYLDNSDLSDEDKHEFLHALWNLVCEFVMLGFEVHPLQQIPENACGKDAVSTGNTELFSPNMVDYKDQKLTDNFKTMTETPMVSDEGGVKT